MGSIATASQSLTPTMPLQAAQRHAERVSQLPDVAPYPTGSLDFINKVHDHPVRDGNQSRVRLNIIIVGAGLGGLATATALARRGHLVTVFEQAPQLGEVGAGIQVPSNSTRFLLKWGVTEFLAPYVSEPDSIKIRRWKDGDEIGRTQLVPDFRANFEAPYYVIHRAHYHDALHKTALRYGVTVRLNSHVKAYDPRSPSITLDDGTRHSADLIVAADGVQSIAGAVVTGNSEKRIAPTGFAAYRATVDVNKMRDDPDTARFLEKPALHLWVGDRRHVMSYSIAAGKSFNMVLSHPELTDPSKWKQESSLASMKREFEGWDPILVKIINMIDSTMKWPLITGTGLSRWVHPDNRLIVLGDAAHPMLPYMSQGAAMAIEDGAALAESLHMISSQKELSTALDLWQQVRRTRTLQMQQASLMNGVIWHYADGPEQRARDQGMRAEVEQRPIMSSPNQWTDPVTQRWCYGYDAEREMQAAWGAQRSAAFRT